MRAYEDLVKSLRYCAEYDCTTVCPRAGTGNGCITRLKKEAADAIEELSMKLHGDEAAIAGMKREIERMVVLGNKPRWIPVTERLPERTNPLHARDVFLVRLRSGCIKTLLYEYDNSDRCRPGMSPLFKEGWAETATPVTHWMPLPEPPKEDDK